MKFFIIVIKHMLAACAKLYYDIIDKCSVLAKHIHIHFHYAINILCI